VRNLTSFLLVLLFTYVALCALLFLTQRSQIYFQVPESNPVGAESIRFANDGIELKVWVVSRPGPKALIYFGGNAEDVAFNLTAFTSTFPDHTIYLVNYRGYGGSTGSPSESGLAADAIAFYDFVRPRQSEISVIGRSLGAGVAVQLASVREVDRLVLVTPFDSLVNVARAHFSYIPVGLLLLDRYDSTSRVRAIEADALVVIAGADEIVPRARSDALVAEFRPAQPCVVVLEGAMHNEIDSRPQYLAELGRFLAQ